MMAQGTDGYSRGDLENGVATGSHMLDFVPLNVSAFERQSNLEAWLRESTGTVAICGSRPARKDLELQRRDNPHR